ncbi:MAG: hypothetical protein U0237_01860 [Thermoleophilia bacterium]
MRAPTRITATPPRTTVPAGAVASEAPDGMRYRSTPPLAPVAPALRTAMATGTRRPARARAGASIATASRVAGHWRPCTGGVVDGGVGAGGGGVTGAQVPRSTGTTAVTVSFTGLVSGTPNAGATETRAVLSMVPQAPATMVPRYRRVAPGCSQPSAGGSTGARSATWASSTTMSERRTPVEPVLATATVQVTVSPGAAPATSAALLIARSVRQGITRLVAAAVSSAVLDCCTPAMRATATTVSSSLSRQISVPKRPLQV